jgi:hypothetical protein
MMLDSKQTRNPGLASSRIAGFRAQEYAARNETIKTRRQIAPAIAPRRKPRRLRKTEQPPQNRQPEQMSANQDDVGSRSLKTPKFRTNPKEPWNGPP